MCIDIGIPFQFCAVFGVYLLAYIREFSLGNTVYPDVIELFSLSTSAGSSCQTVVYFYVN